MSFEHEEECECDLCEQQREENQEAEREDRSFENYKEKRDDWD